ncbi:MAG: thermopsin [Thermoplasmatales archaeon]|nr:thermopsin [Thermoplasmatales archaeon]MCW6170319.1 thermopsin [Thermoplasmatales archaeon]
MSSFEGQVRNVSASPSTGLEVNPFSLYSGEPAPMGIADYGIGANDGPYEYNTTSFLGIVGINSLSTYNSSLNYNNYTGGPYGMTFQLNVNLQFFNGGSQYVYWVQDVADLNTSSNNINFIDNVWNLSASNANMHNSTVSGNGTVSNSSGTYFYYDCAGLSMGGNDVALHYPTRVEFKMDSLITTSNQPEVAFMYNDGYGWITYDNVVFKFVGDLTADHGFVVNGNNYEPNGFAFYDAELILGGPGGGSKTTDCSSNLQLQLEYWNGHNFQQVVNAFNFGSDTAEGIHNVVSSGMYYNVNGTLFANVTDGNGSLEQIYNRSEIGIINVSTDMQSGTLIINETSYPFINGDINITLFPGNYVWELYSPEGIIVTQGNFSLLPGQYLALMTSSTYATVFTEIGLQAGTIWYVNITGNNLTYDSGPISGTSHSFQLTNGSYTYTVATSDHTYKPSAYSGSFPVDGTAVTVSITFSEVTYFIIFTESNLPSGSTWYVNITGHDSGPITASTYTLSLPNGTYSYTVSTSDHTYGPSSSSGSVAVAGSTASKSVSFAELYTVTFTESGLSSGTSWSVTLNGTTESSTTNTITFSLPNGTYSYTIANISGYNISKPSGSVTVNGKNVTQSINFSQAPSTTPPPKKPSTPTSSNTDLYIIIGAVVAVAVVGAVVAIMRKKK